LIIDICKTEDALLSIDEVRIIINYLISKLGDTKYKKQVEVIFKEITEQVENGEVVKLIIEIIKKQKNVLSNKQLEDMIVLLKTMVL
jgi:hypothetical protein